MAGVVKTRALGALPDLSDILKPGMATIILRTPLGVQIIDPFAPADPTISSIVKALGIEVELKLGPPSEEDIAALPLSTGLTGLLALGGFIAYKAWTSRCR